MDIRYKPLTDLVVKRFTEHLSSRLQSIFVKGSVARGDAIWGVSDLDLVLAFEQPNKTDNEVKREVELLAKELPGGDALVIQRVSEDRLNQMGKGTKAYWLYSCRYDAEVLFGISPEKFLQEPPMGLELANLIGPIIKKDGEVELTKSSLKRHESRHIAKRIINGLALPIIAEGRTQYLVPLEIVKLQFPNML
ncbi:hypothetical protein FE783_36795 [Paenibacillus mesophilus]|uniref:nucleotidyltransferase domain-containing protein n=1 Tax=Paenibacillus mesophilus TaxID=2582849 RepID=UPI00110E96F1|nr:nucleotidyltransferase domain-containing protein [Paenibacillus mesophilus]TMV42897.1 hypothetical protein FE783_36795 [Paenibacillus mesophilus]